MLFNCLYMFFFVTWVGLHGQLDQVNARLFGPASHLLGFEAEGFILRIRSGPK